RGGVIARGGFRPMPWSIERIALAVAALVWVAALGVLAARILTGQYAEARAPTVLRTHDGVTETGVVEPLRMQGAARRVIRWRTREGTVTQTVDGPMRLRTIHGDPVVVTGPTSAVVRTVTAPGSPVPLPGEPDQNTEE